MNELRFDPAKREFRYSLSMLILIVMTFLSQFKGNPLSQFLVSFTGIVVFIGYRMLLQKSNLWQQIFLAGLIFVAVLLPLGMVVSRSLFEVSIPQSFTIGLSTSWILPFISVLLNEQPKSG